MFCLGAAVGGNAQTSGSQSAVPPILPPLNAPAAAQRRPGPPTEVLTDDEVRMEREQAKQRNKDRQESLKRDTDKLLELATELKQSVDKTTENTLSLEVVRKAEQIEKLAHNVREKMKGQ